MTSAEIRGLVHAYHRIRELLAQELPCNVRTDFGVFVSFAEEECRKITERSAPARWARSEVGPVLAAAAGLALRDVNYPPESEAAALRIFGLAGSRPLSAQDAWDIMRVHLGKPALTSHDLSEIQQASGLRLRLAPGATPIDALIELTRPRSASFATQVSHWLAIYFRQHATDATTSAEIYRSRLRSLIDANQSGALPRFSGLEHVTSLTREEWSGLLHGRIPRIRLEFRASYDAATQFIAEYWRQSPKKM